MGKEPKEVTQKEIGKRLKEYIDSRMEKMGIESYRQLDSRSGVSNSEINAILSGRRQKPNPNLLKKLAEALGGSYTEMLDIVGYLSKNKIKTTLPKGIDPIENIVVIPVVGVIRAGQPIYAEENLIGYEPINPDLVKSGEYFFLLVTGDSMIDSGIKDGSFVLIRRQEQVENGEIAVVMVDEENATVKKVYLNEQMNSITLQPDNSDYAPQTYPTEYVRIIGKVVRAIIDPNRGKNQSKHN
jgi:repressor LexA